MVFSGKQDVAYNTKNSSLAGWSTINAKLTCKDGAYCLVWTALLAVMVSAFLATDIKLKKQSQCV